MGQSQFRHVVSMSQQPNASLKKSTVLMTLYVLITVSTILYISSLEVLEFYTLHKCQQKFLFQYQGGRVEDHVLIVS